MHIKFGFSSLENTCLLFDFLHFFITKFQFDPILGAVLAIGGGVESKSDCGVNSSGFSTTFNLDKNLEIFSIENCRYPLVVAGRVTPMGPIVECDGSKF